MKKPIIAMLGFCAFCCAAAALSLVVLIPKYPKFAQSSADAAIILFCIVGFIAVIAITVTLVEKEELWSGFDDLRKERAETFKQRERYKLLQKTYEQLLAIQKKQS